MSAHTKSASSSLAMGVAIGLPIGTALGVIMGNVGLTYQVMELEDAPGHTLTVYPAVPGSPSDEALKLLASWAATENITEKASSSISSY